MLPSSWPWFITTSWSFYVRSPADTIYFSQSTAPIQHRLPSPEPEWVKQPPFQVTFHSCPPPPDPFPLNQPEPSFPKCKFDHVIPSLSPINSYKAPPTLPPCFLHQLCSFCSPSRYLHISRKHHASSILSTGFFILQMPSGDPSFGDISWPHN